MITSRRFFGIGFQSHNKKTGRYAASKLRLRRSGYPSRVARQHCPMRFTQQQKLQNLADTFYKVFIGVSPLAPLAAFSLRATVVTGGYKRHFIN